MCVCVCVCVRARARNHTFPHILLRDDDIGWSEVRWEDGEFTDAVSAVDRISETRESTLFHAAHRSDAGRPDFSDFTYSRGLVTSHKISAADDFI